MNGHAGNWYGDYGICECRPRRRFETLRAMCDHVARNAPPPPRWMRIIYDGSPWFAGETRGCFTCVLAMAPQRVINC